MRKKIIVSGTGACLVDRLYNYISFSSETFLKYCSKERGDGGLTPGHLVLKEKFESFMKEDYQLALNKLTNGNIPEKINIGGPCIVALIHAAQMSKSTSEYKFYGCRGKDDKGDFLFSSLKLTPVDISNYKPIGTLTPATDVLSDPDYDNGHGERVFINTIGSAWDYLPEELDDAFFNSDVVVFGATALVPQIHDHLTTLLEKAKSKGCITVVNTVFDFRNEELNPKKKWPLGKSDDSYKNIDLLITDLEETLRLSGKSTINEAMTFFHDRGTGAVVVTDGAKNISLFSNGSLFKLLKDTEMPISEAISKELKKGHLGDTTGCGDNFVGGVISSLTAQLQHKKNNLDLMEACSWGIVSGGYTCFYVGGTYIEKNTGEKQALIEPYFKEYIKQIADK